VNKKQKILTIVALAVFGAIIFFHYYGFDYSRYHEETQYLVDATEKPWLNDPPAYFYKDNASKAKPDMFDDLIPPKKRMTNVEFRKKNALYPGNEKGEYVIVEYPATGPFLTSYPGIKDVRMPLFVLAVFYLGLFFILATPRAPKS
jgi:hypothetical protein